jgi:hypothetical protein
MLNQSDCGRGQAHLEFLGELPYPSERDRCAPCSWLEHRKRKEQFGSEAIGARLRIGCPPTAHIGPIVAAEGDLAAVTHPVPEFVATRKSLTAAPGICVNRDDGAVPVSDDPGFASGEGCVPYRSATVLGYRFDFEVFRLPNPKVSKNLVRGLDRAWHLIVAGSSGRVVQEAKFG